MDTQKNNRTVIADLFKTTHFKTESSMKNGIITTLLSILAMQLQAQNVGIGISNPLYKLDVAGFVRNSSTAMTSPGLFGRLTAGGSLRIENSDNSKFIVIDGSSMQAQLGSLQSSGTSASPLLINPYGGNVGIGIVTANATLTVARGKGGDGTAAFAGTDHVSHFNYSNGESTYIRGGKNGSNVFINDSHSGDVNIATGGGNINTGNGIYSTQTGGLNIVPLGIIKYSFELDGNGNPVNMNINNEAGSLYTSWEFHSNIATDDRVVLTINFDAGKTAAYSKIITIGSPDFEIGLYPIYSAIVTNTSTKMDVIYNGDCLVCQFSGLTGSGTYIIYGIK